MNTKLGNKGIHTLHCHVTLEERIWGSFLFFQSLWNYFDHLRNHGHIKNVFLSISTGTVFSQYFNSHLLSHLIVLFLNCRYDCTILLLAQSWYIVIPYRIFSYFMCLCVGHINFLIYSSSHLPLCFITVPKHIISMQQIFAEFNCLFIYLSFPPSPSWFIFGIMYFKLKFFHLIHMWILSFMCDNINFIALLSSTLCILYTVGMCIIFLSVSKICVT